MALTLTTTAEIASNRMTALIYGPSGIGKTYLAKTLADGGYKVLILSAESGLLSLAGTRIDVIPITCWQDLQDAYIWLSSEKQRYDFIFIDSLTEISGRCVEHFKRLYTSRSDGLVLWGEYNDAMTALMKSFRDLSYYSVIFLCLARPDLDDAKRRYMAFDVQGSKLPYRLPSLFDEVFAMRMVADTEGKESRWLVTQPLELWEGKDRSGQLSLFEPPDLAAIARKIIRQPANVSED